jgi:hypothetical protein
MRYKRNPHKSNSEDIGNNKESPLHNSTKQLLKREITGDEYRQILRDNSINPNAEAINRIIRQHENGNPTKFDELYYAIHKFQSDIDPTKLNFTTKHFNFNGESKDETKFELKKNSVPNTKGNGLIYLASKKPVYSKYNNYCSNKDLFDWESSALNKFKRGEFELNLFNEGNPRHKNVYQSQIFPGEMDINSNLLRSKKKGCNMTSNSFVGSGDFLTWKGDVKGTSRWETKEIKRKDPNELRKEDHIEKISIKLNRMQIPSGENMLIINK